jgi:hypothetical protein
MNRTELLAKVEELRALRARRLTVMQRLVAVERERAETKATLEREAKAFLLKLTDEIYAVEGNRQRAEAKAKQEPEYLQWVQRIEAADTSFQQGIDGLQRELEEIGIALECLRWELQIWTTADAEDPAFSIPGAEV